MYLILNIVTCVARCEVTPILSMPLGKPVRLSVSPKHREKARKVVGTGEGVV